MNKFHEKILEMRIRQSNIQWLTKQIIVGIVVVFFAYMFVSISLNDDEDTRPARATPSPAPGTFTVEYDEAYLSTRQYIWDFLKQKGFTILTVDGIPQIGRIEDANPDDRYVPWYVFAWRDGKWQEYNVLLFDGEVISAIPNKVK